MLYKNGGKIRIFILLGLIIVPIIVLISGYYIATNVVSPMLNEKPDVSLSNQPYVYRYKIPAITFYYVLFAKSDSSNASLEKIYQKELQEEECTGIYTNENDAKLIAQKLVSAKINAKIKTIKINDIEETYTGTDKSEFDWVDETMSSLKECITTESVLLRDVYSGKAGPNNSQYENQFAELKTKYQEIVNKVNSLKIKDSKLKLLRNTIRTMAVENMIAVDGAGVSYKLNDGNTYKIAEDSFIQCIELYKNMISELVQR